MAFSSLMSFAALLYRKLRNAAPEVRAIATACIRDVQDSGMMPLGMRPEAGRQAYVWLLFDRSRLTLAERERYVHERTPPGAKAHVIDV